MHLGILTKGVYDKNTHGHCKQQIIWEAVCVFFRSISLDNGLDGPLSDSLFLYSSICFEASKDTKIKMSSDLFLFVFLVYNISI